MRRILSLLCLAAVLPTVGGCGTFSQFLSDAAPKTKTAVAVQADANPPPALGETLPRALYLKLVRGLEEQGKNHAALAYLDDYAAKFPGDPAGVLLRATALAAVDRPDAAAAAYRSLLGTDLASAAHDGLGRVAALRGDWRGARDQFRQAVALSPTDAKALNNYGFALIKLGDLATAEFSLRQAVELAPASDETHDNLTLCLHLEGKAAAAEALIAGQPSEQRRPIEAALAQWPTAPATEAAPKKEISTP